MPCALRFFALCICAGIGCLYIVSPLWAAWTLRQAVKAGDTPRIAQMVDWPRVRQTLRSSIVANAQLLPIAEEADRQVRPTLWQRMRSIFGHSMVDRFIERYVTPEGLPELYQVKQRWNPRQPIRADTDGTQMLQRLREAASRLKRAEFLNLFTFEVEMLDRHVPSRSIVSRFRLVDIGLTGFTWQLTELTIRAADFVKERPAKPRFAHLNGFR